MDIKRLPLLIYFIVVFLVGCQRIYKEANMSKNSFYLSGLISQFESDIISKSTEAYEKIYLVGKEAIPYLIERGEDRKVFSGASIMMNPLSSQFQSQEDITVGIAALYLTEAIIRGDKLHSLNPLLLYRNEKGDWHNTLEKQKKATEIYKKWWEVNKHKSLEQIRKEKHLPLVDFKSDVCWYGLKGLEKGFYSGE